MNNGTSKTLRGHSRRAGDPDRAYEIKGKVRHGTIRLVESCDRFRYRKLKRAYKRGEVTL